MKKFLLLVFVLFFAIGCETNNKSYSFNKKDSSTLKYDIIINKQKAGDAYISSIQKNDLITTRTKSTIKLNGVSLKQLDVTKETTDLTPIESISQIEIKNNLIGLNQNMLISAKIKNGKIDLNQNGQKQTLNFSEKFYLAGSYGFESLKKNNFKIGSKISAKLYVPGLDSFNLLEATTEITGIIKYPYKGQELKLFVCETKYNDNLNDRSYIDKQGITYYSESTMMNVTIEMVLQ